MATVTPKLGLIKPAGGETLDVSIVNANMDELDAASGSFVCTSTTRPSGGNRYIGQQIYETDTGRTLLWTGSVWQDVLRVGLLSVASPEATGSRTADTEIARIAIPSRPYGRILMVNTAVTATMDATSVWRVELGWDETLSGLPVATVPAHSVSSGYMANNATGSLTNQASASGTIPLPASTDCCVRSIIRKSSGNNISIIDAFGMSLQVFAMASGTSDASDWVSTP